jgi:prepilin-type N-terminal cleavage/methylation domain-containing protein
MRLRRGFTLIELLVVIAIIAFCQPFSKLGKRRVGLNAATI